MPLPEQPRGSQSPGAVLPPAPGKGLPTDPFESVETRRALATRIRTLFQTYEQVAADQRSRPDAAAASRVQEFNALIPAYKALIPQGHWPSTAEDRGRFLSVVSDMERCLSGSASPSTAEKLAPPSPSTAGSKQERRPESEMAPDLSAFRSYEGLRALSERVTTLFDRYEQTLRSDAFRGDPTWEAHNQEFTQQRILYSGITRGYWPTDTQRQEQVLKAIGRMERCVSSYERQRGQIKAGNTNAPTSGEALQSRRAVMPGEDLARETFGRLRTIYASKQFADLSRTAPDVDRRFRNTMIAFTEIYQSPRWAGDTAMRRTVLEQWAAAIDRFEPALGLGAAAEGAAKTASTGIRLRSYLVQLSTVTIGETATRTVLDTAFNRDMEPLEIRQRIYSLGSFAKFPDLPRDQLESLLFIRSRMPNIAGPQLPGESAPTFNRADVPALASALASDALSRPQELYSRILTEQRLHPASTEARGVRMALGLEGLTAEESRQLSKGLRMASRPVGRALLRLTHKDRDLGEALDGLRKVEALRAQLPSEVYAVAARELESSLAGQNVQQSEVWDPTPRRVSEQEMRYFQHCLEQVQTYLKESQSGGQGVIREIEERTQTKIGWFSPAGLSQRTVEWLIESAASPEGKFGVPADMSLWVQK